MTPASDLPSPAPQRPERSSAPAGWTFFSNHSHVLLYLAREPDMPLRSAAQAVGITERAVQRIVRDLEEAGILIRVRVGRRNRYEIRGDQSLRHPIEAHETVGNLLAFLMLNQTGPQTD
ncbi:ArsR family transcriptional regulator (plasmid) [Deinococcus psychrotolerans]|uniref:ArsR family transcriptional regulator n=1 Tax=Deinococcus psychrotolerans TaxID=2489213 RepID=A0A3G8YTF2_9DEIO|nr:winged helix-turn-helix domain-containing protein [Deinococcus psychrotolerans]AZI44536.1 ArsR family transcriptional regulator [Deinococcus psychrotolerans]